VLHYLHDVLGSVVALTNSVGQVVERYDYDPYGTTTIMDAAAVPLALKPIDPAAADGYYHDHDRDGDIDAADYTDLMDCVNSTPYDPMCIYTHDRTGDRRVDIVDVGVYLAYADDQGLAGGTSAPELVHYGRPLRLQFDADGDGRVDMFDWYAMQTCFTKNTTRCNYLFDDNGDGVVNFYDLTDFKQAADGPQGGPGATQWRRKLVASRYGNPFMWTGQRYDATTGHYHFWARTYSPRLGRWMQRDPSEYHDGVNLYRAMCVATRFHATWIRLWTDRYGCAVEMAQPNRASSADAMIRAGGSLKRYGNGLYLRTFDRRPSMLIESVHLIEFIRGVAQRRYTQEC
jgi:RHS repeat-associated protein